MMQFTLNKPAHLEWKTTRKGTEFAEVQTPEGIARAFEGEDVLVFRQHGLGTYEAEIVVNAGYKNLKNVRFVQPAETPRDAEPPKKEQPLHPSNDYHLSIEAVRHNAMTSAIAADFHLPPGEESTSTWRIEMAKDFERYYLYG